MAFTAARIFLEYVDHDLDPEMARTHWGVAGFLTKKLKEIKHELTGPEVKNIDLVNIFFIDPMMLPTPHVAEWVRCHTSFQYEVAYDVNSLLGKDPIENLSVLLKEFSNALLASPWPQTMAIGRLLSAPLSDRDLIDLKKYVERWRAKFD